MLLLIFGFFAFTVQVIIAHVCVLNAYTHDNNPACGAHSVDYCIMVNRLNSSITTPVVDPREVQGICMHDRSHGVMYLAIHKAAVDFNLTSLPPI